jgi:hypothetical protein
MARAPKHLSRARMIRKRGDPPGPLSFHWERRPLSFTSAPAWMLKRCSLASTFLAERGAAQVVA